MAEEVYGEFDHRARYPYRQENKFLIRYTKIVSKAVTELDDLISTCFGIKDAVLSELDRDFQEDHYIDWSKRRGDGSSLSKECSSDIKDLVVENVKELANNKILRKGE